MNSIKSKAIAGYAVAANAGAFGLFWYDKRQATIKGWRVPEKTLQLTALMGGWPAGMVAMEMFRHKTRKEPFRTQYFTCVTLNSLMAIALATKFSGKQALVQNMLANNRTLKYTRQQNNRRQHY